METFLIVLGPVLALCSGVIILAVFFNVMNAIKDRLSPAKTIKIKKFLNDADRVTLELNRGQKIENVRFLGFTDSSNYKSGLPYQLLNMVILETTDKERILLRADSIRSIRQLNSEAND